MLSNHERSLPNAFNFLVFYPKNETVHQSILSYHKLVAAIIKTTKLSQILAFDDMSEREQKRIGRKPRNNKQRATNG